jgi:FkbM family methyltransferase
VKASYGADFLLRRSVRSYAQAGEDIIARFALRELGIMRPFYVDIGAHHPTWLSNTYYFYRRGCHGVCVEADPKLNRKIQRRRRRDTCLNVAVGTEDGTATLHVMKTSTLSTISTASAGEYADEGQQERGTVDVPMLSPSTLLREHCPVKPNLVSLDIEGIDLEVLGVWDFDAVRPEMFIVETLTYTEGRATARKRPEIAELMAAKGYFPYADTRINTIFVDEAAWARG